MAKLADAVDSKSAGSNPMRVRVPLSAPSCKKHYILYKKLFKSTIYSVFFVSGYDLGTNGFYSKKFKLFSCSFMRIILFKLKIKLPYNSKG